MSEWRAEARQAVQEGIRAGTDAAIVEAAERIMGLASKNAQAKEFPLVESLLAELVDHCVDANTPGHLVVAAFLLMGIGDFLHNAHGAETARPAWEAAVEHGVASGLPDGKQKAAQACLSLSETATSEKERIRWHRRAREYTHAKGRPDGEHGAAAARPDPSE